MMNEFPYVNLVLLEEQTKFKYDQEQLIKRHDSLDQADLANDLGERLPEMSELTDEEQVALMLALDNALLAEYVKTEQVQLSKVLGTVFNGETEFALDLEHLTSNMDSADAIDTLVNFSKSNPMLCRYYQYENQHDNVDLVTTC